MRNEIEDYRAFVAAALQRSLESKDGVVFGNRGIERTRVVIDAMIGHAQRHLRILSGTMNIKTYSPLSLLERLRREPKLAVRALVDRLVSVEGSALAELSAFVRPDGPIEVRQLASSSEPHLIIADDSLLRLETDQFTRAAVVAFNRPGACTSHIARFEFLWGQAGPLLTAEDLLKLRAHHSVSNS